MTDTLEAVARALAFEITPLTPKGRAECVWPRDWGEGERASIRTAARAAILETLRGMMEPSATMDVAMTRIELEHSRTDLKVLRGREVWQAMLTQKIKEVEGG